ncbi:helicase-exonuclease AddAB subunit AddB [Paenibacillus sp. KACC 21273]|uniref:helicase-exonuclease AddAB subunit AddB n=1 Tax=Paenibacillus sp. KACC 21273 TaxID=3025665 RepID=UPI00236691BE|nr:helicase-exonuclease AddAB subunit AddB [Paenibacillus sp. KACC 21273]WDF52228.1 helicase-exonuclease AddAB subunit AddB [Paenibacillus sp. KACC 21273]
MPLHFLLGRSGSGKTTTITKRIIDNITQQPDGSPILLLVPEQGSFQAQYALVRSHQSKGNVRVQTYGFRRLANWVLQDVGGSAKTPIGEEGKKMLLYRLIQRHQSQLRMFGTSSDQFGFIGKLSELYNEFKRHTITLEQLTEYSERLSTSARSPLLIDKLHDLQRIYQDFEQDLQGLYVDGENTLTDLALAIPESQVLHNIDIWIDGFHSFTPQEYDVIAALLQKANSVTIALTLDRPYDGEPPHELELFHQTATTYIKLKQYANAIDESFTIDVENLSENPVDIPVRFQSSPQLAHLENAYRSSHRWQQAPYIKQAGERQDIYTYAAPDRRSEVESAIREMIRLAREEGARWQEMGVFVRQLSDYEHIIAPLLQDYEIPYFLDQKRSILQHPLAEFIRSALDIVQYFWRYEDVFRCIKTGLLLPDDGRVTTEDIDRLENVVLASGIHGSRWTDGHPWKGIPSLSLEAGDDVKEISERELVEGQRMQQARQLVIDPLYRFEKRIKKAKHAKEMCIALYQLLEDCNIALHLEKMSTHATAQGNPLRAREHIQIYGEIIDLLDQMVDIMAEDQIDLGTFAGLLETGLSGIRLGIVPPAIDQVLIGSMDRTRPMDIKYGFVLGMNEGIVPSLFPDSGILSEPERTNMLEGGLELSPGSKRLLLNEQFLIYHALTVASSKLWLSYALTDDEDKGLLPSEVITNVHKLFPFLQHQSVVSPLSAQSDHIASLQYVSTATTTLPHLIAQLREWSRGTTIANTWWHVLNWYTTHEAWRPQVSMLVQSLFYKNTGDLLDSDTSRHLYGQTLRTSVSGMEQFVSCPFAHFASRGLRLRERQEYRLKAPDIGQLFHASLTDLATMLKEQGRAWGQLTREECVEIAYEAVDKHIPRLQGQILSSSKRYNYISRKLREIVSRASVMLGEQARRGDFEPLYLELAFGPNGEWPPLRFTLENGCTMEIVGRIDRVDVAEGDNTLLLRIIDYKSSQTDLKLHEVYYGLALQMLTYLDVLLTHAEEQLGQSAQPAGALYFHVHNPMLQAGNGLSMEQSEQEMLKRFKMKGLLLADRDVIGKMDNELDKGYSAILPVAVKADGGFYSSSAVATVDQWQELLRNVRQTAQEIGTQITDGTTQITPYRIEQEKACDYCDYKSVCQFDESLKENQYKSLQKPGKNETWELLQNRHDYQKGDSPS